jgi:RHS repeat-associated protein
LCHDRLDCAVTVTDPAGKWKKLTMDAFGRVVRVNEPNPAGGSDYVTTYAYDMLDHLVRADLPRPVPGGTYTQSRTWTYNASDLRLGSQVQPETGSTSFAYNSLGLLQSKTDGKGVRKELTYDSKQRVTAVRYYIGSTEQTNNRVDSYYDTNPFDSTFTQYGTGRLTAVSYKIQRIYNTSGSTRWVAVKEMYSYTADGRLTKKRLQLKDGSGPTINADATLNYDSYGRLSSIVYPNNAGTYAYTYDSLSRLSTLVKDSTTTLVDGVTYGPANELLTLKDSRWDTAEARTYNLLGQLTRIQASGLDLQYTYSGTQNNGQITKMKSTQYPSPAEEVNYSYDSLARLSTAATTSTAWGQSFVYDGWGNRTDQLVTKGSAPVISVTVDAATNRIASSGYLYDGAGNLTKMPKGSGYVYMEYDPENRMVTAKSGSCCTPDGERYGYAPDNRRVYRNVLGSGESVVFWLGGQRLVSMTPTVDGNGYWSGFTSSTGIAYFGGRRVGEEADQLGSSVYSGRSYYPYGQEKSTAPGYYRFATYYQDSWTGLDYADQRYYAPGLGRFLTADPYVASGGVGDPGSWNRYSYVGGDVANRTDPLGHDYWIPGNPDSYDPLAQELYGCAAPSWVYTISDAALALPGSTLKYLCLTPVFANRKAKITPDCYLQVKYRPVPTTPGYNHAYLVVQDRFNVTTVIEGFPEQTNPPFWGNLIVKQSANGERGTDAANDAQWGPTLSSIPYGSDNNRVIRSLCSKIDQLISSAIKDYSQDPVSYIGIGGPNSNSLAHYLLGQIGLSTLFTPPPGTDYLGGWFTPVS